MYTVNKNVLTDSRGILLVDGQEVDVKSDKNWSASKYRHRFWSSTADPLFGFFFFSVTNCVLKFFIFFWTSGAANTLASLISTQIILLFYNSTFSEVNHNIPTVLCMGMKLVQH